MGGPLQVGLVRGELEVPLTTSFLDLDRQVYIATIAQQGVGSATLFLLAVGHVLQNCLWIGAHQFG